MKLKLPCLMITMFSVITFAKTTHATSAQLLAMNNTSKDASAQISNDYSANEDTMCRYNLNKSFLPENPSVIMDQYTVTNSIQRVRLQFSSEDGLRRPLLLGFTPDNAASDGFDYGYDARNFDQFPNDMFWNIENENYVIQGVGAFDTSKAYPLNINITNSGLVKISLTDLENFDSEIEVHIYDALLNTYTQINSNDFEITLESDVYQNRFYIAFSDGAALSVPDLETAKVQVSYLGESKEIYIKSDNIMDVENVYLVNMTGQTVKLLNRKDFGNLGSNIRIPLNDISKGTYIIKVETINSTINKKAIINY